MWAGCVALKKNGPPQGGGKVGGGGGWGRVEFNDPQHPVCFQQGEGAVQVHQGRRWSLWGWNTETSAGGGGQGGGQAAPQVLDDRPQRAVQNTHPGLLQTEMITGLSVQYRTHILASSKQRWSPASVCSTEHTSWPPPNRDDHRPQCAVQNTHPGLLQTEMITGLSVQYRTHILASSKQRWSPASVCSTEHTSWPPPNRDDYWPQCAVQNTHPGLLQTEMITGLSVQYRTHIVASSKQRWSPASVCSTEHTSWPPPNRDDYWPQCAVQNTHPGLLQTEMITGLSVQYRTHILASSKQRLSPASVCSTQHTSWPPPEMTPHRPQCAVQNTHPGVLQTEMTPHRPQCAVQNTHPGLLQTEMTPPWQRAVQNTHPGILQRWPHSDLTLDQAGASRSLGAGWPVSVCSTFCTHPSNLQAEMTGLRCNTVHTSWRPPNRDDATLTWRWGQGGGSQSSSAGWQVSAFSTEHTSWQPQTEMTAQCAVYLCVQTMVWLPLSGIFNVHTVLMREIHVVAVWTP